MSIYCVKINILKKVKIVMYLTKKIK